MVLKTKYAVIILDGMADFPLDELQGKTPVEAARTPNLDRLSEKGWMGMVQTVPDGEVPGSEIANMNILGYDSNVYLSGRGALEAAALGIQLEPGEIAFRVNTISLSPESGGSIKDYSAGHIKTEDSSLCIKKMQEEIQKRGLSEWGRLVIGNSYRHLWILKMDMDGLETFPPHQHMGTPVSGIYPRGSDSAGRLKEFIELSREVLKDWEENEKRAREGQSRVDALWPWGGGGYVEIPSFEEKFGLKGGMISAVDLLKGIAVLLGLNIIDVPGITGFFDTNYESKGTFASEYLKENNFVVVHIEAPDEAGHAGSMEEKVKAIERIDEFIIGPVWKGLQESGTAYKLLLLPDHFTPVSITRHVSDPVSWLIYNSEKENEHSLGNYSEKTGLLSDVKINEGNALMDYFLHKA